MRTAPATHTEHANSAAPRQPQTPEQAIAIVHGRRRLRDPRSWFVVRQLRRALHGVRRLAGRFRAEWECLVLLALMLVAIAALAVATWKDLAGEQLLIQRSTGVAGTPHSADLLYHPPQPVGPRTPSTSPPMSAPSGSQVGRGAPVSISGQVLWVMLNAPLLYLGLLLHRRIRRSYPARVRDVAADTDRAQPVVTDPADLKAEPVDESGDAADTAADTPVKTGDSREPEPGPSGVAAEGISPATAPEGAEIDVVTLHAEGDPPPSSDACPRDPASRRDEPILLFDRRSEQRIRFDILAALKYHDGNTLVRTVDLSMSMLVCRLPAVPHAEALTNGTAAEVTVRLDESVIVLPVVVAWRRQDGDLQTLGLRLKRLGEAEERLLRAAVVAGTEV